MFELRFPVKTFIADDVQTDSQLSPEFGLQGENDRSWIIQINQNKENIES